MTHLLFDLGNTRLKFAPWHADGSLGEVTAISHDGHALPSGWEQALPAQMASTTVADVAHGTLRAQLLEALCARCPRISFVSVLSQFGGLRIAYAQPQTLGVDRYMAMLGARARNHAAVLVAGGGTALTLDLIDRHGQHRGGRIAPSPALMREALHARAPQLPVAGGNHVPFADNTADALRSGCDGAAIALIERALHDARVLLGAPPALLLHGGGAEGLSVADVMHDGTTTAVIAPRLVLEGMASWAREMQVDGMPPTPPTHTMPA